MAFPSSQIGSSQESKNLRDIIKELEKVIRVAAAGRTTTSTTTSHP